MPLHPEDMMRKKPKDPWDGVTVRVSIEIWDSCSDCLKLRFETVAYNIAYLQKAAAQQDAWTQFYVWRGAAGKVASTQSILYRLLSYRIFSLLPGEKRYWGKNSVAAAGLVKCVRIGKY